MYRFKNIKRMVEILISFFFIYVTKLYQLNTPLKNIQINLHPPTNTRLTEEIEWSRLLKITRDHSISS